MKRVIPSIGLLLVTLSAALLAAENRPIVNWSGKDISGADVKVPVDRTSVVAFVRVEQEQSKETIKQIQAALGDSKLVQVVLVVSGPTASETAKQLLDNSARGWAVVADIDFAASGKLGIHVWPTTLVIKSDGTQVAHLAGMPKTFATDFKAYLDYAAGKLDDAALEKQLTAQDVVTDSPAQIAARHLQVAQRMLEQGRLELAQAEVSEGLKKVPQDPMLQLMQARLLVLSGKPKEAIEILDKLPAGSTPAWQVSLVRGRAMIAQDQWTQAKAILPEALKLNPDPAETHYLLGLCYQHDQDWQHAAEQFRSAFEKGAATQKLVIQKQQ